MTTTLDAIGDLPRLALLERIAAVRPALLLLVAPAGFGKSSLVRQLLAGAPRGAVCDCAGVSDDADLARRLLPALAAETPERSAALAQSETLLGDGHASAADRTGVAVAAWRAPADPGIFVFENAEDALARAGDLLGRLLASRPEGRTVVLCTRETPRARLSRFAPPHRILTLRAVDLAFTPEEIAFVLAPTGVDATTLARVTALSAGWPIAVLLLQRFAHEGRLATLLDRLDDVAFDELHGYLADEVLASAEPAVLDGLLAAAAIPEPSDRDLRLALGDDAFAEFAAFARTSPFVARRSDGVTSVHPFVGSTMLERHAQRADTLLRAAAAAYQAAGEDERAAELFLACGDQRAAAEALDRVEVIEDAAPSLPYARVLASLDRDVILRYPRLWAVTALLRTYSADSASLLDEAEALWARLPADAPPIVRIYLYVFRVIFMSYVGDFERALQLIDDFRTQIAAPDIPQTRMHAWLLYLRSLMTARLGRTAEAERDLDAAWPLVNAMHVMASGTLLTLGADVARVRGDRMLEKDRIERAIAHIRRSGLANFVAFDEAEATFGAWLAGEDADFAQHALALENEVERESVRGFAFFASVARGHAREPQRADLLKWVACGYLLLAAQADGAEAIAHAEAARSAAARYRAPFYQVLAALALAELEPRRAPALHAEAAHIAQRIDSAPLRDAVAAAATRAPAGFLESFCRRYRHGAVRRGGLTIEIATGRVLRDGEPMALPDREQALLLLIAVRGGDAVARERITDALWPDLDDAAARNAFHVCLHRLKARLGDDAALVRDRDGYRLGAEVRVDLREIDRAATALRSGDASGAEALYERLCVERPAKFAGWEWFEPTERHLRELRCEVAQRLAQRALDDGRPNVALTLAHETIEYDGCDEPARELAIRAYLALGDRAAALRHFRQYRDVLETELACEPSDALAALLNEEGP